jgi:hypothetical protein
VVGETLSGGLSLAKITKGVERSLKIRDGEGLAEKIARAQANGVFFEGG